MRVELNITLRCNQACANCNRLCHLYPDRKEDIDPEAIAQWIAYLRVTGQTVNRVKVVGGEPLLHPQFRDIYCLLGEAVNSGEIKAVKVDTNGTLPIPSLPKYRGVRIGGRKPRRKEHLPYLWSPMDLGEQIPRHPCDMPRLCGFSLDNRGWLPCSPAIMIVRSFGLEHLYKRDMPTKPWGISDICRHCIHAMPDEWKRMHCKPLGSITAAEKAPTVSWARALQ